jgi:hypothetical protein
MRLSWLGWLWFQFIIPTLSAVMAIALMGIPFALVWPPMTKSNAWFCIAVGLAWLVYCVIAQRRKLRSDGLIPPFERLP